MTFSFLNSNKLLNSKNIATPLKIKDSTKKLINKKTQFRASKQFVLNILHNHIIDYPTPKNLNYFYNFGSIAGIILVIQIITGILLTMHYTPNTALAFLSLEHIMRDVNMG
jgi:ubiquinol-cytochrome c reductase cytochrome b subunit